MEQDSGKGRDAMNTTIYQNIATRTAGDIYIGIVGPVRTGKSTFIKRFMETQVIPNIENIYRKERARDELPQSGSGRTIMTAEPKFVPEEAAQIQLEDGAAFSVRLIDCVGYMVRGAIGQYEADAPRMVTTPWCDHEIPMTEAAEIGTRKVIAEHATIGIVVTTDGTIADIPREDYLEAEERVIRELQELGKPFIVLLNSSAPTSERAMAIARDITSRYEVNCVPVNCLELDEEAVVRILKAVLYEFPLQELDLFLPPWVDALSAEHPLKAGLYDVIRQATAQLYHIREIAFDRWGAVQMTQNLEGMGFTVVPFGQGFKDMSPPTKELMKLVLEERIAHGGHPVLRWMMDNIFIRTDPAGNIKPDKEKSTEKIDGAVATIMALDRAIRCGNDTSASVYDDRGILFI